MSPERISIKMKVAIVLIISIKYLITCQIIGSLNRYEVIPEYFEFPLGENDKIFNYGSLRPKKFNRTTYVIDGIVQILQPFHDQLVWHLSIYVLQGNEYRQYSMRKGDEICSAAIRYRPLVLNWFSYMNLSYNFQCPIQPGRYWIHNLPIENQMLVSEPPKGDKFRINYTFFENDEVISACAIYVTIVKLPVFKG